MPESIFKEIKNQAEIITEQDIDSWVLPSVMLAYDSKLKYLAYRVYGNDNKVPDVAVSAFKELAKQELHGALNTFFFKKRHWVNGRELDHYLRLCLNRLAQRRSLETGVGKYKQTLVCPLCRESGRKEILTVESNMLRCKSCTDISERILDSIKKNEAGIYEQCKYNVHSKFALHSKKGYKCPECSKFIPSSVIQNDVICPYDGCIYIGSINDLEAHAHPTASLNNNKTQSIDSYDNDGKEFQLSITDSSSSADAELDVRDQFDLEHKTLIEVIAEQLNKVKRTNSSSTVLQKALMYQAYQHMIDKFPVEMVAYLVHRRQKSDFPIQARIFQEYAGLVENQMPITINKKGEEIYIVDLTDPNLSLFNGISVFETKVNTSGVIPNKTKEEYVGGRNFKNYGPCFIGKIIDVVDKTSGHSIINNVVEYSFSQIKMDESIKPDTSVVVTHYRILSHYEMDSLVFLQRIRRAIVDSVYRRLTNKKRKVGIKNGQETN